MRVLLALICMLALTTSASAECAWVLWVRIDMGPKSTWSILSGFPSIHMSGTDTGWLACEKKLNDTSPKLYEEATKAGATGFSTVCIPDTVDPRGPKGK